MAEKQLGSRLFNSVHLAQAMKGRAILRILTCLDIFGSVLLISVLQQSGCATYRLRIPPTVMVAREFFFNIVLLRSKKHFLSSCRQKSSSCKKDARLERRKTALNCRSDSLFESQRNTA